MRWYLLSFDLNKYKSTSDKNFLSTSCRPTLNVVSLPFRLLTSFHFSALLSGVFLPLVVVVQRSFCFRREFFFFNRRDLNDLCFHRERVPSFVQRSSGEDHVVDGVSDASFLRVLLASPIVSITGTADRFSLIFF